MPKIIYHYYTQQVREDRSLYDPLGAPLFFLSDRIFTFFCSFYTARVNTNAKDTIKLQLLTFHVQFLICVSAKLFWRKMTNDHFFQHLQRKCMSFPQDTISFPQDAHLVPSRCDVVSSRYDVVSSRYDVVSSRYDVFSSRYDVVPSRY